MSVGVMFILRTLTQRLLKKKNRKKFTYSPVSLTPVTTFRSLSKYFAILPKRRGEAMIAINQFDTYYNVRARPIKIMAGQGVHLMIQPTKHASTGAFRKLSVDSRKCLYPEEVSNI